jgi:folate-binding protein YgfZ
MNTEWQSFLQSQGAKIQADGAVFPEPPGDDCNLYDLSHLGLIAVHGANADSFLQGQITNDVRELTESHSHLAGHCSAKGRMIASFRALRRAGVIYLQLPEENLAPLLKRLNLYKLRADVTLSDADADLARIGLAGDCAEELLAAAAGPLPKLDNEVTHHRQITIIRLPGQTIRYEVLGPPALVSELWKSLRTGGAHPANRDRWALMDIHAGLPTVYASTAEAFVPQMANMQLVDGVSFTKGCYTGQEVVARMQYLGKLKRRMYRASVQAESPPLPGDELYAGGSTSGQGAGRVVDARPSGDGRYELLAVVEISAADAGDVRLGEDGPALAFLELPYEFPATAAAED